MAIIHGRVLGDELCRALGIDPLEEKITSIKIECHVDGVAVVTIERMELRDSGGPMVEVLQRYNLVEAKKKCPICGAGMVKEIEMDEKSNGTVQGATILRCTNDECANWEFPEDVKDE